MNNLFHSRLDADWHAHLILGMDKKERELGYTTDDLHSVQEMSPRFPCPHCGAKNWSPTSNLNTTPTRLWRASTPCQSCSKQVRWLLDPDLPIEKQTEKMHRPLGF